MFTIIMNDRIPRKDKAKKTGHKKNKFQNVTGSITYLHINIHMI